ncbi:acyltransferase domain-containing protein [Chitinophaga sp.]|uniref:acyltransferase domain-containing protein n=1 Tax=Chitinophaga sp. TaxID=1869181 RepID=UPI0031E2425D
MPDFVFMFSGHGSQYYNMGAMLYHSNVFFRNTILHLDKEVRNHTGTSVVEYLYGNRLNGEGVFDDIRYTNPALFMVQYALSRLLQEEFKIRPDYVVGSNVGEMVAAAVSGMASPTEMLTAMIDQARMIERLCSKGGMISILTDPAIYEQEPLLYENTTLAAVDHKGLFTLSADDRTLLAVRLWLDSHDISYNQLPVRFPFHSPLMEPARAPLIRIMQQLRYGAPEATFVSGIQSTPMYQVDADYFWDVLRQPVAFSAAIERLENAGPCFYIDCSPSGSCSNLLTKILPPASSSVKQVIMSPFGQEVKHLQALLQKRQAYSF